MTIRGYLRRRSDRYAWGASIFLLIAGVLMGFAPGILGIRIVFAVLICVVAAAAFLSLLQVPCPNCQKAMGWDALRVGLGSRAAVHCPHCGIGVDSELPGSFKG
ncbi:MAG TPA: hypothetical protein VHW71_18810 [Steroidobacteraceae bacterium]|jgi:hypothetical protein|nr:hypothetical protein [Steroidobacteraceae bacterium]